MNHAFIIVVHNQPEQMIRLIRALAAPNHYFYIHVDKKSADIFGKYKDKIRDASANVRCVKSLYSINWGGANQFLTTIEMLKIAFSDKEMEYFHLISGQDYPVVSIPDFDTFFDAKRPVGLMSATRENIFDWQQRYEVFHFTDLIDKRSHPHLFFIAHCLSFIQSKIFNIGIRIRTVVPLSTYYGSNWFSLNREVVSYVLGFLKENKRYLRRFRFTYACDEIFFQTILYNSPYAGKVENNNYRYTDWSLHKSGPKTLVVEDFEQIAKSNNLFCRKVDRVQSKELLDRIDSEILYRSRTENQLPVE